MKLTAATAAMILAFCATQVVASPTPSMRFRPNAMRKATGEEKHPYIIPRAVLNNMDLKRCLAEWDTPNNKNNSKPDQSQDKVMQQLQKAFKDAKYGHIHIKAEPKPNNDRFIKRIEKYIDTLKKVADNAKKNKKTKRSEAYLADESVDVPSDESVDAPADEAVDVPADEAVDVPADEAVDVPADEAVDVPADEYVDAPADEAVDVPADESVDAPADEYVDAPADEAVDVPADEAVDVPADEAVDVPADEAVDVPADEAVDVPADEAVDVPADEAVDVPADEAVDVPADEAVDVPADESVDAPADEAVDVPADEAVDVPADESVDVPADEAVDAPADEYVMGYSPIGKRDVKIQGGCKRPEDVLVALLQVELKQGPRRFGGPMGPRRKPRGSSFFSPFW